MIAIRIREKLPAIVAAALFALFVLLHLAGERAFADRWIEWWRVDPYPFRFLDTDTVLSAVRCFNRGVDAYAVNPCDDLLRGIGDLIGPTNTWLTAHVQIPVIAAGTERRYG